MGPKGVKDWGRVSGGNVEMGVWPSLMGGRGSAGGPSIEVGRGTREAVSVSCSPSPAAADGGSLTAPHPPLPVQRLPLLRCRFDLHRRDPLWIGSVLVWICPLGSEGL